MSQIFVNIQNMKRNWVFVTNSDFLIPIFFPRDGVNLWYLKLRFFQLTEFIVWNIWGLRHWVAKILRLENQSLWQYQLSHAAKFRLEILDFNIFQYDSIEWKVQHFYESCKSLDYIESDKEKPLIKIVNNLGGWDVLRTFNLYNWDPHRLISLNYWKTWKRF